MAAKGIDSLPAGGVVSFGGKNYAVGLTWLETDPSGGNAAKQAKTEASAQGAEVFCVRKDPGNQYGLGRASDGHKKGMIPLAALMSEGLDGSMVGAFDVPGGFYLIAVRDGKILDGCDRVIPDETEAHEAFAALFYLGTWTQASAPEAWKIENSNDTPLDTAIGGVRTSVRLQDVSSRRAVIKIAGIAAVVAVVGLAYQQYESYVNQREQAALQAKIDADRAESARLATVANKPVSMPWDGQYNGIASLLACYDGIMASDISVPGWAPISLTCNVAISPVPGSSSEQRSPPPVPKVSLSLRRDGGTINWIGAMLDRPGFKPFVSQANGLATVTWNVAPVASTYPAEEPKNAITSTVPAVSRYLVSQFEETFHAIDVKEEANPPISVTQPNGQVKQVPPSFKNLAFSFKTRHDPTEFAAILAPLPAFILTSEKLDLATWTWTIEGKVYEKLPVQAASGTPSGAAPRR